MSAYSPRAEAKCFGGRLTQKRPPCPMPGTWRPALLRGAQLDNRL
jgi:hypothetical protein